MDFKLTQQCNQYASVNERSQMCLFTHVALFVDQ